MKYNIKVNYHSSICIDDTIYIDPYKTDATHNATVIFITHSHYDHLDLESIDNVRNNDTLFVCTQDSADMLIKHGIEKNKINVVCPDMESNVLGIHYETFPAYNIDKHFHLREKDWVGYILTINGIRYMICGDSDLTREIKRQEADVLFVPIGGTYTMTWDEAAILTDTIHPQLVVPVHYGSIVGDKELYFKFAKRIDKSIKCMRVI